MSSIKVDNFSHGVVESAVDVPAAKVLRNAFVDQFGKPYRRGGIVNHTTVLKDAPIGDLTHYRYSKTDTIIQDYFATLAATQLYMVNPSGSGPHQTVNWDKAKAAAPPAEGSAIYYYGRPISDKSHIVYPLVAPDGQHFAGKVLWCNQNLYGLTNPYAATGNSGAFAAFNSGFYPHMVSAGLPKPNVDVSIVNAGGSSPYNYVIYVVFLRAYYIGGTRYEDRSIPYVTTRGSANPITGTSPLQVEFDPTNNPLFPFLHSQYMGGSSLQIEIYRTKNNQTIPFRVGSSTVNLAGTTTISSGTADTSSFMNFPLYTTGGYAATGLVPPSKFACVTDKTAWYGYCFKNTYQTEAPHGPNIVMQSVPGDLDGVPLDFYYEFDGEVTQKVSNDIYPIVFESDRLWRIEGQFAVDGSGGGVKRLISDKMGCPRGGTSINVGGGFVLFTGHDQMYITDGFKVAPYSDHFKKTYSNVLINPLNQVAWGSPIANTVTTRSSFSSTKKKAFFFTTADQTGNDSSNVTIVDHRHRDQPIGNFTTMDMGGVNGTYALNVTEKYKIPDLYCSMDFQNRVYFGSDAGTILVYDEGSRHDSFYKDIGATFQEMEAAIQMEIETSHLAFGDNISDKWMTSAVVSTKPMFQMVAWESGKIYATFSGNTCTLEKAIGLKEMKTYKRLSLLVFTDTGIERFPITLINTSTNQIGFTGSKSGRFQIAILEGNGEILLSLACKTDLRESSEPMRPIMYREPYHTVDYEKSGTFKRRFPKRRLRSVYKTLELSTPLVVNHLHAVAGPLLAVTYASGYYTLTVPASITSSYTLPDTLVGQYITFYEQGFLVHHKILSVSSNLIRFQSPNIGINTSSLYEIKGYDKNSYPSIESVTFNYIEFGQSIEPFSATSEGGYPK